MCSIPSKKSFRKKQSISKKEWNLIRNSQIIDTIIENFSFLKPFVDQERKITLDTQEFRNFVNRDLSDILNIARKEWHYVSGEPICFSPDNLGVCQLCHYSQLMEGYYIENNFTNKKLLIGSECLKQFLDSPKTFLDDKNKHNDILERILQLNNNIPQLNDILNNGRLYLESFDTFIPENLEKDYNKLYNDIKNTRSKYIKDKKMSLKTFNSLKNLVCELEKKKKDIQQYVNKNRSNPFIPYGDYYLSLKSDYNLLKQIKRQGRVTRQSLPHIKNIDYIKTLIPIFNTALKTFHAEITDVSSANMGTIILYIVSKRNKNIHFPIKYKEFTSLHTEQVYHNKPLYRNEDEILEEILKLAYWTNTFVSDIIIEIFSLTHLDFAELYYADTMYQELIIKLDHNKFQKSGYYLIKLEDLLKFSRLVYYPKSFKAHEIIQIIKNGELKTKREADTLINAHSKGISPYAK
ncbi:hypothetical protein LI142_19490 [Eubacterium limosum]|uniref:Uncharacterized protein n=1 Tax=Eubacterium limosum TaxID=1736 RepID=A0ABT5UNY7_EUBLI|nr:hypothetical protein [Eubacterium limosum]MCB6571685.1 hypothetical protein [Eubacterium limosum]MDE1470655.1 hypothetical protein [Eubacterium limosum]